MVRVGEMGAGNVGVKCEFKSCEGTSYMIRIKFASLGFCQW